MALVFEIYINDNNYPFTNIELPKAWSFYPGEEEVLLMPFFCFTVLDIVKDKDKNVTTIKL